MSVKGTWYNELGSMMNLEVNGASITGTYQTAVGSAEGTYQLVGSIDSDPTAGGEAIAWVVVWNNQHLNSHSITAWSGQYQTIGEEEEISSLWLLTREEPSEDDWSSTLINQDIFTRTKPSETDILKAKKRKSPSHPVQGPSAG